MMHIHWHSKKRRIGEERRTYSYAWQDCVCRCGHVKSKIVGLLRADMGPR